MLTQTLKKNKYFQSLPIDKQEVFAKLANTFQEESDNLFRSPEELTEYTQIGNPDMWTSFLALEATQSYIKNQMTQITLVAQRKAFLSLQQQAQGGNVGAVKEINELSGIMQKSDNNRIVVLHRIDRPTKEEKNVNG